MSKSHQPVFEVSFSVQLLAEFLGTLLLVCVVVGSGIMAEQLSQGNDAIALLANTLATVWALYFLIEIFLPISGSHFNPAVSGVMLINRKLRFSSFAFFSLVQCVGAVAGALLANAMFELDVLQVSTKERGGAGRFLAETVATFGLILVILRAPVERVAALVACFIGAAYWFTASTSFANPAVTIGRIFSDTFAGISPAYVLPFITAQCLGALLAVYLNKWMNSQITLK